MFDKLPLIVVVVGCVCLESAASSTTTFDEVVSLNFIVFGECDVSSGVIIGSGVDMAGATEDVSQTISHVSRLSSPPFKDDVGEWLTFVVGTGNEVDGEEIGLIEISFSLSREFNRRSETRSLLGDAISFTSLFERHLLLAIKRLKRLFFGDGSISFSEKSDISDDGASKSIFIGIGDAVVRRL